VYEVLNILYVRLPHSSILTIHDKTARIKENARSEKKELVLQDYNSPI